MKTPIFIILAVISLLLSVSEAKNCTIEPLVLPIRNVTFPNGIGANRGVKLILGDQTESLRLSTILNNTRVRNQLDCPTHNMTEFIACAGASGSIYSTTNFTSVQDDSDWDVVVIDPQPDDGSTTVVYGYDVANFIDADTGAVIDDYPLEVWSNVNSVNLSALALGPASSTLERLMKHDLAPSSSWGLDYGSTSELYPRDGQLVIGGVNEARFNELKKTEFDMWGAGTSVNCPLQVLISDVILTNEEGDHSLLPDADSKISACIDTIQNSFTLTEGMFAEFQKIGNHIDSDGRSFGPSSFPLTSESLLESLKIKLSNGYESVIPHYELITHERGTNEQGKYAVMNSSRLAATVSYGASDLGNDVPVLGGVFLSQNYLQIDYEESKFWLSPQIANGTKEDIITSTCHKNKTSSGQSSDSDDEDCDCGPDMGVKVGVPVAATVSAAVGVMCFILWRRNRKLKSLQRPETSSILTTGAAIPNDQFPKSPLSAFTQLSHQASELDPYPRSPSVVSPHPYGAAELPGLPEPAELDSKTV